MKNPSKKFFCFRPTKDTAVAFAAGFTVIVLSAAMLPARQMPWLNIAIRDVGQMLAIGVIFPLLYLRYRKEDLRDFGLSFRRWYLFLPISLLLAGGLLAMFLSETPPGASFRPDWWKVAFIMCAGIFEVVFFYAFLRTLFERAFGIIPGIVLAALFYAFHHIGFQPEYGKLIFVGLMYATVFRLGNSALLIYPFFWGIGGSYDVLVQSQVVSPLMHAEIRTLYLAIIMIGSLVVAAMRERSARQPLGGYSLFTSLFLTFLNREAASPQNRPDEVLNGLGLKDGWSVADIGSGGGYFTLRFARQVGPKGTVYAVDTRSDYLAFVKDRAGKKGLANVTAVPVGKEGPDLPPAAFDLVFMRNVFHHLSEPEEYARALKKCLRAGGKLVIVEHKPKGGVSHVALFKHHTSPEAIVETLDKAGLTMVDSLDLLPKQSFLVFSPKKTVAGDPIDG